MSKEDDRHFAQLGMKIASDRSTWMLRTWVLARLLKAHGVDVEYILKENDKEKLNQMLQEPAA